MAIGWNFPNNNNGEIIGIGEAGIETFKGSLFSSLAREICQNSLDARVDFNKPVKIEFVLNKVNRKDIYGIDDLSNAINLCKQYWSDNKKTLDFFTNAYRIVEKKNIRVLRISDYNTTGLTGSDESKNSPWQDLVKSSGVSNKSGELGGSFGIGKSAPFACSDLRTIFYNTFDIDGLEAYQGVSKLVSFQFPDKHGLFNKKKGEITQGKGYYGEMLDNSAVNDQVSFTGFRRYEVGTDVYILGFLNHSEWKNEIIKSVIDGYLISILQNNLEVVVDDVEINTNSIHKIMEDLQYELPLAYNYYQVLTDDMTTTIKEDFEGLGELELKVLVRKDFRRRVLMARNNGMKIFDKDRISGTIHFAAVCILKDKDLNEYFRQMENPQHNAWESDRFSEDERLKKEAANNKKALFRLIRNKVVEVGKMTVLDEMDAVGAGDFVPDINLSFEDEGNKAESISEEIIVVPTLEKVEIINVEKGLEVTDKAEFYIDDTTDGDDLSITDLPNSLLDMVESDGSLADSTNSSDQGEAFNDDSNPSKKLLGVNLLKLRIFMFDDQEKIYKLSFTPDKSADEAYVEISIAGEQGNSNVDILSARNLDGKRFFFAKNKIYIGKIKENKSYSVLFSIDYTENCSMGVIVNGYQV